MNAKRRFKLALVGTDSIRAREIKNVLGRKKLKVFDLDFFDPEVEAEYSKLTEFKKEPKVVHGVTDERLAGKDEIFIGPVKREASVPRTFWIWAVADNLRRGSALNAFDVARRMLEAGSR